MKIHNDQKGIISIMTVLGIGLFVFGISLTIYIGTFKQLLNNRDIVYGDQTFYAAESAMSEATYQVLHSVEGAYAGGTMPQINNTTPSIAINFPSCYDMTITGSADGKNTHREVVEHILITPECQAFSYGIFTPNHLEMNGNVSVNFGGVFATNSDVDDILSGSTSVDGDIVIGIPPIAMLIPNPPAFPDKVFDNAADAETYLDGKNRKAVIYVNNPTQMKVTKNNTELTGSLWVTGDLDIGGGQFTAVPGKAAIVVEGNLNIHGNLIINGLVYVMGNTSIGNGNITINGSLVSIGGTSTVDVEGNVEVNYDPNILELWKNFEGFNTIYDPKLQRWEEK